MGAGHEDQESAWRWSHWPNLENHKHQITKDGNELCIWESILITKKKTCGQNMFSESQCQRANVEGLFKLENHHFVPITEKSHSGKSYQRIQNIGVKY